MSKATSAKKIAIRIVVLYAVIVIMLAALQRRLMYFPSRAERITAQDTGLAADRIWDFSCTTKDNIELHGWHILRKGTSADNAEAFKEAAQQARYVVLYFHGNGGDRRGREYEAAVFNKFGADTIVIDYRGYGENKGTPSEAGLAKDARAVWKYATETLEIPNDRIVIVGASLGGGVACRLAAECCESSKPPAGIILRSTFSSMTDAASTHYPWLPVSWILIDRYDSVSRAPAITCPVLQVHGNADTIVPIELGEKLHGALPNQSQTGVPKAFVEFDGIDHNNLVFGATAEYEQAVDQFFQNIAERD